MCFIRPYPPVFEFHVYVAVQPFDPRIEYKHEIVKDGDVVIIETPAEIKCIVDRGRPAAKVIWENEDLSTVKVTAVADGEFINVTNTLEIRHFPSETKPIKRITCVAHHPYYLSENNQRRISITVASTYPT